MTWVGCEAGGSGPPFRRAPTRLGVPNRAHVNNTMLANAGVFFCPGGTLIFIMRGGVAPYRKRMLAEAFDLWVAAVAADPSLDGMSGSRESRWRLC